MPATSNQMRFTFRPLKPGIFCEQWRLRLTPPTAAAIPPVVLRGVCLSAPEPQHLVRTLDHVLTHRKLSHAMLDILDRDILPAVYRVTIPDSERIDSVLCTPAAPAPAANTATATASAYAVAERYAKFMTCYGSGQAVGSGTESGDPPWLHFAAGCGLATPLTIARFASTAQLGDFCALQEFTAPF